MFSERFKMNLAFTLAIVMFVILTLLPILHQYDIFNFRGIDEAFDDSEWFLGLWLMWSK